MGEERERTKMATQQWYTVPDWHQANANIQSDAMDQRDFSNAAKYDARRTADVTYSKTRWEKHLNDVRLEDRINDIEKWRNELERVLAKAIPEAANAECLALRSQRREIDHVLDTVNDELLHEEKVIAEAKRILAVRSQEAFDHLMKLKGAREALAADLGGKYHAIDVDSTALGINEQSSGLSYIKDLSQVALGNSDPAAWNAFSQTNRDNMEQMINASIQLRDLIET